MWLLAKSSRQSYLRDLSVPGVTGCRFRYQVTEPTLEKLHRFDLYMGGIMQTDSLIPADDRTPLLW
ncbi:MAG: hypothetical protein WKG07_09015 [Hymenobacter sp.]